MSDTDYGKAYAEQQLARKENSLRQFVKQFYLQNLLKDVQGATIDFGCGAGQILERLPPGSVGLEVNAYLVDKLKALGLNAEVYVPEKDQLQFNDLAEHQFKTLVMSHVLEHFEDAADGLRHILNSCERLGITRVIIVVPGKKGYSFDDTHQTFVTEQYIKDSGLMKHGRFNVRSFSYFPINHRKVGDYFTFHELKIIFDAV